MHGANLKIDFSIKTLTQAHIHLRLLHVTPLLTLYLGYITTNVDLASYGGLITQVQNQIKGYGITQISSTSSCTCKQDRINFVDVFLPETVRISSHSIFYRFSNNSAQAQTIDLCGWEMCLFLCAYYESRMTGLLSLCVVWAVILQISCAY